MSNQCATQQLNSCTLPYNTASKHVNCLSHASATNLPARRLSGSIVTYGSWGSGKSFTLGSLEPQQLSPENESAGILLRCALRWC